MNTNSPFPEAAPDFRDPLGLIRACHQRVLDHSDLLEQVIAKIEAEEVDGDVREAAKKVFKYFSTAAKHHHQDEEQDIFPILVRQSLKIAEIIHNLKKQHQEHDQLWAVIGAKLSRLPAESDPELKEAATKFIALQREHVQIENDDLFMMAQHILSSDDLKKIGKAMAERRGVRLPFNF